MKVEDAIRERRSIRAYSTKEVSMDDLAKIMEAAKHAPMAGNIFTVRLVVIENKKKKADVAKASLAQNFMKDASYIVIVCSDTEQATRAYGKRAKLYMKQQAGAAIQNMLLRATDLGIGTCWVGAFNEQQIRALIRAPDNVEIEAIIPVGWPAKKPKTPLKQDSQAYTYFEEYGHWYPGAQKGFRIKEIAVRESSLEK